MRFTGMLLVVSAALFAESVAGLKWTAPAGWKSSGSTSMRAATYVLPAAPGDQEGAECVVYFFGAGQGGTVEANIDRWKGQFTESGKPAAAKVARRAVHQLPVTTIETAGDYSGMGGPTATAPSTKHGYRLLGAIIEGPVGNIFIKFAGAEKTVAAHRTEFEQLLESFEKQ